MSLISNLHITAPQIPREFGARRRSRNNITNEDFDLLNPSASGFDTRHPFRLVNVRGLEMSDEVTSDPRNRYQFGIVKLNHTIHKASFA